MLSSHLGSAQSYWPGENITGSFGFVTCGGGWLQGFTFVSGSSPGEGQYRAQGKVSIPKGQNIAHLELWLFMNGPYGESTMHIYANVHITKGGVYVPDPEQGPIDHPSQRDPGNLA
jgi:hypothetical protein